MTRPTIIFCPKIKAKDLSESSGIPLMTFKSLTETLDILNSGGTIIVSEDVVLMGWAAPRGTSMFFIEGFPLEGSATRIQAEGRVARYDGKTIPAPNQPIRTLPFSRRVFNVFEKYHIAKVGDLYGFSRESLLSMRHFGQKCLTEVSTVLRMRFPPTCERDDTVAFYLRIYEYRTKLPKDTKYPDLDTMRKFHISSYELKMALVMYHK